MGAGGPSPPLSSHSPFLGQDAGSDVWTGGWAKSKHGTGGIALFCPIFLWHLLLCLARVRPACEHPPAHSEGQSEQDHVCTSIFSFPGHLLPPEQGWKLSFSEVTQSLNTFEDVGQSHPV